MQALGARGSSGAGGLAGLLLRAWPRRSYRGCGRTDEAGLRERYLQHFTRRAFGELAAGTAAFLTAFNGPLVFYENMLLRDSLIGFAGLAIVTKETANTAAAANALKNFI